MTVHIFGASVIVQKSPLKQLLPEISLSHLDPDLAMADYIYNQRMYF